MPQDLKYFPSVAYDQAAFRQALANALHSPWQSAAVESIWLGTDAYIENCVKRDGLREQRRVLGELRWARQREVQSVAHCQGKLASDCEADERAELERNLAAHSRQLDALNLADERMVVALLHAIERGVSNYPAERDSPTVNLINNVEQAPIEVSVQLPARKTDTTIQRDKNGNIVKATQHEVDA